MVGRLQTYETYAMNLKKEYTDHYDWYLFNLSIKKDAQGKGIASKLMRPMLQFCDDERMIAYLETNKEANVGLYRHYGFDLKKEEQIPKSTVTHYAMVRNPKETQ
jgi:ribosomal protein S18 acetylase RimI-like enzyme